jgi:hypothetical protein
MDERVRKSRRWGWLVWGAMGAGSGVTLFLWGRAAGWNLGEALGVAGLAISVAGFSVAIWQLHRTQTAATAAFDAIHSTLRGVAASRLASLIVELRWAIQEYEQSLGAQPDLDRAKEALTRWRARGGDAETLIKRRFGEDAECLPSLRRSRETARVTKSQLFGTGGPQPDLRECLVQMEQAVDALGPLVEQLWPTEEEK